MPRYFLRISYDGTAYHGWQVQPNAVTVQGLVDNGLGLLLQTTVETTGCGRTDTGVHARRFFLHVDSPAPITDARKFLHSLNAILPRDIAAHELIPVSDDAHARFDATLRTYEYHLVTAKDPFLNDRAYLLSRPLDFVRMNEAATHLLSHTEYGCFCKGRTDDQTTACTITFARWQQVADRHIFTISANRFLRNMVRSIVGTLLEIGEGSLDLEGFKSVLESGDRSESGRSVPAHGLYLTAVHYPFIDHERGN